MELRDPSDALSYSLSYSLSFALTLLVITIWSTSHYWRILFVSWFATLSLFFNLVSQWRRMTFYQITFLGLLFCTLFLWSTLLTPVQLLFQRKEAREPTSAYQILYDPTLFGVKPHDIKVE